MLGSRRHRNKDCGSWYKDRLTSQILVLLTSSNIQESTDYIVMTASSRSAPSAGHRPILTEVPPISPTYVIDFFEARRWLLTESQRTAENSGMNREVPEPASGRKRSLNLAEAFEEGSYWLIWAAVLTALALGMFGL